MDIPLFIKHLNILDLMSHTQKVIFCWLPSQRGLHGKEKADIVGKSGLNIVHYKNSKIS